MPEDPKEYIEYFGIKGEINRAIMQFLIHYERENDEYVLSRIKSIQRKYNGFLRQANISREGKFLIILKRLINKPDIIKENKFRREIKDFISLRDIELGDSEIIKYNAWLTAKLENKK